MLIILVYSINIFVSKNFKSFHGKSSYDIKNLQHTFEKAFWDFNLNK